METESLHCPNCMNPVGPRDEFCPYCKGHLMIRSVSEVNDLSGIQLRKYQSAFEKRIEKGEGDLSLNETALAFIFLKLKMYDKANEHFLKAMDTCFDNPDLYYGAAICQLRGQKAFVIPRTDINKAEEYLNTAIEIEPKGIYYYFLAYIRYDHHARKFFNVSPNYREYLVESVKHTLTRGDIDSLYAALGVECPPQVKL